jgi:protein-disulfide isomerase
MVWRVDGWLCGALLTAAMALSLPAAAEEPAGGRSKEEVEAIVRDYLMREPEVIFEALQVLQQKRATAEAERQKEAILANRDQIYDDPETPVLGADSPEVTMVEFFDYRCTYCRRVVDSIQTLIGDEPGLRVAFKELPVLGPDSVVAAKAALASEAQGGYRDMHFALMEAEDLSKEAILGIAEGIGLDPDQLARDMESPEIQQQIERNYELANELGIEGTPAFVVGDELIPGAVDQARLKELIEGARPG